MSMSLSDVIAKKLQQDSSFKKKLAGQSKTILLQRISFVQSKKDNSSYSTSLSKKYRTLSSMSSSLAGLSTSNDKGLLFCQ